MRASKTLPVVEYECSDPQWKGGRREAKRLLKKAPGKYADIRNIPSHATCMWSAPLKFGTMSVREAWASTSGEAIRDQLLWREFFSYVLFHRPDALKHAYQPVYRTILWTKNDAWFRRWCEGKTGYPLVDAGMRQLAATGWMHGRPRMVCASFLSKTLGLPWQLGERHFARSLIDYDPAVNNGNWQWVAGTGLDPEKYGAPRVFHPTRQLEKFDPDLEYVRRWIPELCGVPDRDIFHWETAHQRYPKVYCPPMVDHAAHSKKVLVMFADAKKKHSTLSSSQTTLDRFFR
jgi:deoxyribodipyrimidine photo-lyase